MSLCTSLNKELRSLTLFEARMSPKPYLLPHISHRFGAPNFTPMLEEEGHFNLCYDEGHESMLRVVRKCDIMMSYLAYVFECDREIREDLVRNIIHSKGLDNMLKCTIFQFLKIKLCSTSV